MPEAGDDQVLQEQLPKVLEFEPMASWRSTASMKRSSSASILGSAEGRTHHCNRYLGKTLRKGPALTAWRKLKIMDKAPVIEQYQNERQVEYVFDVNTIICGSRTRKSRALGGRFRAQLGHHAVEIEPRKDCAIIAGSDDDGTWGDLVIKTRAQAAGPQARAQITQESKSVLETRSTIPNAAMSFSQPRHPDQKLQPWYSNRNGASPGKACP